MQLPEHVIQDLRKRPRRVDGHLPGAKSMLDEGRECRNFVTRLSAASKASERAGATLVASGWPFALGATQKELLSTPTRTIRATRTCL